MTKKTISSIDKCECCNEQLGILEDGSEVELGEHLRCSKCGRFIHESQYRFVEIECDYCNGTFIPPSKIHLHVGK